MIDLYEATAPVIETDKRRHGGEIKRLQVEIDADLLQRLKQYTLLHNTTIKNVVTDHVIGLVDNDQLMNRFEQVTQ